MNLASVAAFFSHIPTDWIILFAAAVIISFDSLRSGNARAKALALSLPVSFLASGYAAESAFAGPLLKQASSPLVQGALMLTIIIIVFLIILRITNSGNQGSQRPVSALLSGVAAVTVLVVIWLQVEPLQALWHFGPTVEAIFGASYRLYWLLAAYAALAFVRD